MKDTTSEEAKQDQKQRQGHGRRESGMKRRVDGFVDRHTGTGVGLGLLPRGELPRSRRWVKTPSSSVPSPWRSEPREDNFSNDRDGHG